MHGGAAAPTEEVRGTNLSWVPVFNTVVLALPWMLLATRAEEALVSCGILACFPGALAQHPALDCAAQDRGSCAEHTTPGGGQSGTRFRQRGVEHCSAHSFLDVPSSAGAGSAEASGPGSAGAGSAPCEEPRPLPGNHAHSTGNPAHSSGNPAQLPE